MNDLSTIAITYLIVWLGFSIGLFFLLNFNSFRLIKLIETPEQGINQSVVLTDLTNSTIVIAMLLIVGLILTCKTALLPPNPYSHFRSIMEN